MSRDVPIAALAQELGYAIKRAQHALRIAMDRDLRPIGLTTPQYSVLSAIAADPGASNAHLARLAFVTPQSMQEMLANLERAGLISREADPNHGRILRNELTDPGHKLLKRAHAVLGAVGATLVDTVGPAHAAPLASSLIAIASALEAPSLRKTA
jgi:DNA-binding MarR family transcriptional regulator